MNLLSFVCSDRTLNRCHTFEPPVEHEALPVADEDDHSAVGGGAEKDDAGDPDAKDQEAPPQELTCVRVMPRCVPPSVWLHQFIPNPIVNGCLNTQAHPGTW